MNKTLPLLLFVALLVLQSCRKPEIQDVAETNTDTLLHDFSTVVAQPTYNALQKDAAQLHQLSEDFVANPSDSKLEACRAMWKSARLNWELSEGFLFGPVATGNIDPRIDTWPINFTDLDSIIAGNETFTEAYINNLEDALKGFHPVEYLIFGINGAKTAAEFSAREKELLVALTLNLSTLTTELADSWSSSNSSSYHYEFITAGKSSSVYESKQAVFEELANAMIGICDEVAGGKIGEPFLLQDPSLEESPYSNNSLTDFLSNMQSVENVYAGKFQQKGTGLQDLVKEHNLQLDATISSQIEAAKQSLKAISLPFGQAILDEQVQVQNAIDAIETLKETLEDELIPFIQLYANE